MLGVRNVDAVIARLARTGESRFAAVKRALLAEIAAVQVRVRAALDGGMLQSPRLRDAITVALESDGTRVTATLSIDGVPYAAIQEYGGTVSIPEIVPGRAKALAFEIKGREIFARRVRAHSVTIPAHAYLRDALAGSAAAIMTALA